MRILLQQVVACGLATTKSNILIFTKLIIHNSISKSLTNILVHLTNISKPPWMGGVNRGTQICRSVANSMQTRQSVSNSLSNSLIREYFCSNPHTPKFGQSQKQTKLAATSHIFHSETGVRQKDQIHASFWIEMQFKMGLELWQKAGKVILNYSFR